MSIISLFYYDKISSLIHPGTISESRIRATIRRIRIVRSNSQSTVTVARSIISPPHTSQMLWYLHILQRCLQFPFSHFQRNFAHFIRLCWTLINLGFFIFSPPSHTILNNCERFHRPHCRHRRPCPSGNALRSCVPDPTPAA